MTPSSAPRVAILWDSLSGYFDAQLAALADAGAHVLLVYRSSGANAPFDGAIDERIEAWSWNEAPDGRKLERSLEDFHPDALLVISWHVGEYRRAARRWRGRTLRVLCMDNQWWGTAKQWAGVALSPWLIRPTYDVAMVAGERQAEFARRLGIPAQRLIWGVYTGDYATFSAVAQRRGPALPPQAFLYVGRLVRDKGIDVLAEAYQTYRSHVAEPWPLITAGTGPEEHLLDGIDGIEPLGFVQPLNLPAVYSRAGCLVLPSRFEPWGVVVHEAASAGLPVVCTRVCGAATRLVLDGYNGAVVTESDHEGLADGLRRISTATDDQRRALGEGSTRLACQYSPQRWAANLLQRVADLGATLDWAGIRG